MCAVTIYNKNNEILMKDVFEYEIDLLTRKLIAYTMEGEKKEFILINSIKWNEMNDKMIIE